MRGWQPGCGGGSRGAAGWQPGCGGEGSRGAGVGGANGEPETWANSANWPFSPGEGTGKLSAWNQR
jgi:hypothetical protein